MIIDATHSLLNFEPNYSHCNFNLMVNIGISIYVYYVMVKVRIPVKPKIYQSVFGFINCSRSMSEF